MIKFFRLKWAKWRFDRAINEASEFEFKVNSSGAVFAFGGMPFPVERQYPNEVKEAIKRLLAANISRTMKRYLAVLSEDM